MDLIYNIGVDELNGKKQAKAEAVWGNHLTTSLPHRDRSLKIKKQVILNITERT
jgi:hypothetical protein